jgi:hypothetical protein
VFLVFGAPSQLLTLVGQEHGRTIPLADIRLLECPNSNSSIINLCVSYFDGWTRAAREEDECLRTIGNLSSMARKQSSSQKSMGVGFLFAAVLAGLFFVVASLSNKGHISVATGVNFISLYWTLSLAYFLFSMCRDLRVPYKLYIGRMRLNWRFEWIALVYVVGTLFCSVPLIHFLSVGFYEAISASFKSYSVRVLMASYGASLFFCIIVILPMTVEVVAARRGTRCFKQSRGGTAHSLSAPLQR